MTLFKIWKSRKLIKRFIELDEKQKAMEEGGCLKRACSLCSLLESIDEHRSTCPHEEYGNEMQQIYRELFPKESPYEYTWKQKVERVRELKQVHK